jgi:hypothetical protein
MRDCNKEFSQTDEEILRDEVSDEAVEAASGATGGYPTLAYGTYCFTCPSSAAYLFSADEGRLIARGPGVRKARKSQAPQSSVAGKASPRPELENNRDPKRTSTVQDFLQRKFILEPISPVANPCCNPTLVPA